MSLSLREQLLQAGLGTKKQAKQAEHEQHQRNKSKDAQAQEQKRLAEAQAARAAKAARDLALNRKQQEQAAMRARHAEIKQLIEQNRVPKLETDEYFNFIDRQKVRRLAVDGPLRERLIRGELMIVRCEGRYDVVPADIAARIRERNERAVVTLNAKQPEQVNEDDPYKDYVVPDDLKW